MNTFSRSKVVFLSRTAFCDLRLPHKRWKNITSLKMLLGSYGKLRYTRWATGNAANQDSKRKLVSTCRVMDQMWLNQEKIWKTKFWVEELLIRDMVFGKNFPTFSQCLNRVGKLPSRTLYWMMPPSCPIVPKVDPYSVSGTLCSYPLVERFRTLTHTHSGTYTPPIAFAFPFFAPPVSLDDARRR